MDSEDKGASTIQCITQRRRAYLEVHIYQILFALLEITSTNINMESIESISLTKIRIPQTTSNKSSKRENAEWRFGVWIHEVTSSSSIGKQTEYTVILHSISVHAIQLEPSEKRGGGYTINGLNDLLKHSNHALNAWLVECIVVLGILHDREALYVNAIQ